LLRHDPSVIGDLHVRVLHAVARANEAEGIPDLRLDGGTALAAFYLGHRQSEDLDIFAGPALNAVEFGKRVAETAFGDGIAFESFGPSSRGFARFVARDVSDANVAPVRVDLASTSPFLLDALQPTEEGVPVASFRDVCAGKVHALSDRFEARDFIDLHAILNRPTDQGESIDESLLRARFKVLVDDLLMIDPGMEARLLGEGVARGLGKPLVAPFKLRVLIPITDDQLQATINFCVEECVRIVLDAPAP
jgi:Nucleotidyl transferase AbiEii toxin, Type IV TA system